MPIVKFSTWVSRRFLSSVSLVFSVSQAVSFAERVSTQGVSPLRLVASSTVIAMRCWRSLCMNSGVVVSVVSGCIGFVGVLVCGILEGERPPSGVEQVKMRANLFATDKFVSGGNRQVAVEEEDWPGVPAVVFLMFFLPGGGIVGRGGGLEADEIKIVV